MPCGTAKSFGCGWSCPCFLKPGDCGKSAATLLSHLRRNLWLRKKSRRSQPRNQLRRLLRRSRPKRRLPKRQLRRSQPKRRLPKRKLLPRRSRLKRKPPRRRSKSWIRTFQTQQLVTTNRRLLFLCALIRLFFVASQGILPGVCPGVPADHQKLKPTPDTDQLRPTSPGPGLPRPYEIRHPVLCSTMRCRQIPDVIRDYLDR